jgi:predicted phage baseplate assembly protein
VPLKAPEINTPSFAELVRMAQLRVPRYAPEWTDFNESDPGNTLIQLFAWLTEMMLVQMNRVPERNYIKFLQLLGLELRPAQPATAHLTFTAQEDAPLESVSVLQRTRVSAQPPAGGDPVIFETIEGLSLIRVPLIQVQVFDGNDFSQLTEANNNPGTTFRPLGWAPQKGNALYLGFTPPKQPPPGQVFPQEMGFRIFLPISSESGKAVNCRELQQAPAPPVTLVWEYKAKTDPNRWRRLNVYKDDSIAFTREGYIDVQGPADIVATKEAKGVDEPLYWIRVRLADGSYPAGRAPVIDFIRPNTVEAESLSTARDELVGESEGIPDQSFTLRYIPILPKTLKLWITEQNQQPEQWELRDDFLSSNRESKHFKLNGVTGEIAFGNGIRGLIPSAGAEIVAREYRYGGGKAGNLPKGTITTLMSPVTGVDKVTNERPSTGGRDEQEIEELKQEAPKILRSQKRAVSKEDYASIAMEVGEVAKAQALPLSHPDHPGVEVPGVITVVIVPDADIADPSPKPSADLILRVCRYLDERRLLTTELYVKGPKYQSIKVEAVVAAQPYAASDDVKRRVIAAINEYLDPLGRKMDSRINQQDVAGATTETGGEQMESGWRIGGNLFPTNLIGVIQRVKDVLFVRNFKLIVDGELHDKLNEVIEVPADGLLYGVSDQEITVEPYSEQ